MSINRRYGVIYIKRQVKLCVIYIKVKWHVVFTDDVTYEQSIHSEEYGTQHRPLWDPIFQRLGGRFSIRYRYILQLALQVWLNPQERCPAEANATSQLSKMPWSMVSKAANRSSNTRNTDFLESRADKMSFMTRVRAVSEKFWDKGEIWYQSIIAQVFRVQVWLLQNGENHCLLQLLRHNARLKWQIDQGGNDWREITDYSTASWWPS